MDRPAKAGTGDAKKSKPSEEAGGRLVFFFNQRLAGGNKVPDLISLLLGRITLRLELA